LPDRSSRAPFSVLYPILDASLETEATVSAGIEALARAGCVSFQLRVKERSSREFHRWAREARAVSHRAKIRLLVNDRVDVAMLVEADGVHLGQEDLSPESARRLLGDDAVIGLSTHDLEEARRADGMPVDYVAIGPIFETRTRKGAHPALGIEGARRVRDVVVKPLVAIGGITLERAPALLDAGIDALAVISALKAGTSLETVAREWLALSGRQNGE
jgi:thiamine-phosphate pyrophosphorylase